MRAVLCKTLGSTADLRVEQVAAPAMGQVKCGSVSRPPASIFPTS